MNPTVWKKTEKYWLKVYSLFVASKQVSEVEMVADKSWKSIETLITAIAGAARPGSNNIPNTAKV